MTRHDPLTTTLPVSPAPRLPVSASSPGGLKKVSFAKAPKKEDTKSDYPVFNDSTGQVALIAERIKRRDSEIEALTGAQQTDKAELKMFVAPFYFTTNRGKAAPPSSISVQSAAGEVLVTFQNRYSNLESEDALIPILGEQVGQFFRQAFDLKVKGELLPADRAQDFVNDLQELLTKYNALDALEIKEEIKPTKDFHIARHTLFTPEVNMALEQVCPITAMIKTKGRGSK